MTVRSPRIVLSGNEEDAYDEVRDEDDAQRDHGPPDGVERALAPGCALFLRRFRRHVGGLVAVSPPLSRIPRCASLPRGDENLRSRDDRAHAPPLCAQPVKLPVASSV